MTGPVTSRERLDSIDVLRGVAVMGILVMNIQSFSDHESVYSNPSLVDFTGWNYWIWIASHVLAYAKFMTIFSLLFGAGIVLMSSRREAAGESTARVHYRRMGWLALFGMLHAYLLWIGDILFWYGMSGMLAYLFRNRRPRALIVIGVVLIAVPMLLSFGLAASLPHWPEDAAQTYVYEMWEPTGQEYSKDRAAYLGDYAGQLAHRIPDAIALQTFAFAMFGVWRVVGTMLLGMALFKLGVLSAERPVSFYRRMAVVGAGVGIPVVVFGLVEIQRRGWEPVYSMFYGAMYNYWASLLVAGAWIAVVMLVCKAPAWHARTRPVAAVGRMAFTNYIMQSVVCTWIYYGHGLGLYGQTGRATQMGIVAAVLAAQLVLSPLWLRYFRFGPLEWLWRSLTYASPQPILARTESPAYAPATPDMPAPGREEGK